MNACRTRRAAYAAILIAIVFTLVPGATNASEGIAPLTHTVVSEFLNGSIGSAENLASTLNRASPILLCALAVLIPFRAGMFNLGAEGQLISGALAAAWVGTQPGLNSTLSLPIALLLGFMAGATAGAFAGELRVRFGVNELISTLLLNYVCTFAASYAVNYPLRASSGDASTNPITVAATMPPLVGMQGLHAGIAIAFIAYLIVAALLHRTVIGYEAKIGAANQHLAQSAGIDVNRLRRVSMGCGGGLAGLAGAIEVCAIHGRYFDGIAPGLGFDGVTAAVLGACQPFASWVAGLFLAALKNGALSLDIYANIPREVATVLQGLLVLLFASRLLGDSRPRLRLFIDP